MVMCGSVYFTDLCIPCVRSVWIWCYSIQNNFPSVEGQEVFREMFEIFDSCIKIRLLGDLILLHRNTLQVTLNQRRAAACFLPALNSTSNLGRLHKTVETRKFNSEHGKRATILRNENRFRSISNTHQMAKIITVAREQQPLFQRTVSCILLYLVV